MCHSIFEYEHPFLTVDGVLLRVNNGHLEVLLVQRNDEFGGWALPGGFVPIDRLATDILLEKVEEKTGVSGFYFEQLKTYDGLNRDPRYRVVSIAYICITNRVSDHGDWFRVDGNKLVRGETSIQLSQLSFDHGQIIADAIDRIRGKLWWSDISRYFLNETFTIRELIVLYQLFEGKRDNFRRKIAPFLEATGVMSRSGGRPAELYRWKGVNEHVAG